MKKLLLTLVIFFAAATGLRAQDTLFFSNGSRLVAKVTEVGLDEIKYQSFERMDGPLFTIAKSELIKIHFADGNKLILDDSELSVNPSGSAVKKTNAVKFEFFSPLNNCITLGYERLIKKGVSLEVKLGAIGAGFDPKNKNPSGALFKGGVKFMNSPDYYVHGMKRTHPLRGGYIKPELLFSSFSVNKSVLYNNTTGQTVTEKINYTNLAVNIVFGKQKIMGECITFDWYIGVGYGGQWSNYSNSTNSIYGTNNDDELDYDPVAYSHVFLSHDFPLVLSGGLSIGYLFGK